MHPGDKIQQIYAHVAPEIEHRLLATLEDPWSTALNSIDTTSAEHASPHPFEILPALNSGT